MNDKIEGVLNEREESYGSFKENSRITQEFHKILLSSKNYKNMSNIQKTALYLSLNKIARIITGNPNHLDSYIDISGYLTLIVMDIENGGGIIEKEGII